MDSLMQLLFRSADGAFAVDAGQRIVFWNPACERLLGQPARAAMGRQCCEVLGTCDSLQGLRCQRDCCVSRLAHGGVAPKPVPLWFGHPDGSRRPLWLSILLVPSQWQDLWTVVHLLQHERPDAVSRLPAPAGCAAGSTHSLGAARSAPLPDAVALTAREREILGMLAEGLAIAEISRQLYISPVTVRNHVQHLIAKLGLHSQLEAVAYAYRNDLVAARLRPQSPSLGELRAGGTPQ